jgi:hypothetical protein
MADMAVDNYAEAIALTEKIKANLPITVHAGKEYRKLLKKQGNYEAMTQEMVIDSAVYMGDEGGICCGIQFGDKQVQLVSITHLEVDSNHPLATEIQSYQRQRTRTLMLQNSRSFMAEMQRLPELKGKHKKKGDRGFGKSINN